jgi:hypothetical protein
MLSDFLSKQQKCCPASYAAFPMFLASVFLLGVAALLSGCGTSSEQAALAKQSPPAELVSKYGRNLEPVKVPENTPVSVRMLRTISSSNASPGEIFEAELASPIEVNGRVAFLKGARVQGRVVTTESSGRLENPGYLKLTLDSIQETDGKWIAVSTTSISARARSHRKRNWVLIGGGTGVGALIGGLAGGGKGVLIGSTSGAAAGTAGAYATGKRNVAFTGESRLTFITTQELVLKR